MQALMVSFLLETPKLDKALWHSLLLSVPQRRGNKYLFINTPLAKETGVTLAQSVTQTSVPIDMIRVSDNLTMFYIDGPGVFEVFGTRATIREGLSFVKDVTRLNSKAIAVFTQGRLGKRQEEPLQRLVVIACDKGRDPVEFRTRRRDSKLAEELTEILSEKMPDFRAESLLRT